MKFHAATLLVCVVLFTGCGANTPSKIIGKADSSPDLDAPVVAEGTWGHLDGGRSKWLIQEEPGATIEVCGDYAAELVAGLKSWREATGRGAGLKIESGCTKSATIKRTIVIYNKSSSEAKEVCVNYPKAVALTYVDRSAVVICDRSDKMQEVMIHEAGHLWGMCDVYPEEIAGAGNCDSRYFTGRSRASVMGANYSRSLAPADLAGAWKLSNRSDLTGNAFWKASASATVTSTIASPEPNAISTAGNVKSTGDFEVSAFSSNDKAVCVLNR